MSRSKWHTFFVIDLSTYERFLERLTRDINKVAIMIAMMLNAADTPAHLRLRNEYKAVLGGMPGESFVIKGVHADIMERFNDYRLLKEMGGQGRHKRRWLCSLAILATNAEISSIQKECVQIVP